MKSACEDWKISISGRCFCHRIQADPNIDIPNLLDLYRRQRATGLSTVAFAAWTSLNREIWLDQPKRIELPTFNISMFKEALDPSDMKVLEPGREYDSAILPQR